MFELDNNILFYAFLLNGKDDEEKRIQYELISGIVDYLDINLVMTKDELELLVEDLFEEQFISISYAQELLLATKCFIFDDGNLKYNSKLQIDGEELSWETFKSFFNTEKTYKISDSTIGDIRKQGIVKGICWCVNMVLQARMSGMQGLPAFLRCGDYDTLIGKKVAGTATSDALSLICNGIEYLKECAIDNKSLENCFVFLVESILKSQCKKEGWDYGGFYPLEDQPDAEHPTVDATCLAIMALCDFYSNRDSIETVLQEDLNIENNSIEKAVLIGLEFLFHMQQPAGSYGIYKYQEEYPDGNIVDLSASTGIAMPNENCTRMVVSAMGVSKGSGIFDATEHFELYGACSRYIEKAFEFLKSNMADYDGYKIWLPYYGTKPEEYPQADILVCTARVCRSMIPIWWQCEDERETIKKFYADFLSYWKMEYVNVHEKIGVYSFKTPGEVKYSVGVYMWQGYAEMIAAFTILQGYNMFGMKLGKDEWEMLDKVVLETLQMQHAHGHWNLPKTKNPFCAATLAAIELLKESYVSKRLI